MSTEICINLNDELAHSYPGYSGLASMAYSTIRKEARNLLYEALTGNVSKEYAFSSYYSKPSTYQKIKNKIGNKIQSAAEAILDHSAMANEPNALKLAAHVCYFGGTATPPSKVKAHLYIAKSVLQGNYETVGLLHDLNRNVLNHLTAAYHLEQILNSDNLYDIFSNAIYEDSNDAYKNIFIESLKNREKALGSDQNLLLKNSENVSSAYTTLFRLVCPDYIENTAHDNEKSLKEFDIFVKVLTHLNQRKEILGSSHNKRLFGQWYINELSGLLADIKREITIKSSRLETLYRGLEIVFTRIYLESLSGVVIKNDSSTLKDTVASVISEFENDTDVFCFSSPYVARLIALYNIKVCQADLYDGLFKTLTSCKDPEFRRIALELETENLVASSVAAFNRKDVCCFEEGKFKFNIHNLGSFVARNFSLLCCQLGAIAEFISRHTTNQIVTVKQGSDVFYDDCVQLIGLCIYLDPVLAFNDCRYSNATGKLIRYLVDKTGLPPQKISHLEKDAPYYGYVTTTAANLYLSGDGKGKAFNFFSEINKGDQEITLLKRRILENSFGINVRYFEGLKDNPSQNFDHLVTDYLQATLCSLDYAKEKPAVLKNYSEGIFSLLEILYNRAKQQQTNDGNGIASECLAETLKMKNYRILIKQLGSCLEDDKNHQKIKGDILDFKYRKKPKYPVPAEQVCIAGDPRAFAYAAEIVNSNYSRWKKLQDEDVNQYETPTLIQGCLLYKSLLAYDLCCPISYSKEKIMVYEDAFLKSMPDYSRLLGEMEKFNPEAGEDGREKAPERSLHILGNHRLSELLEKKIITQLKADKKKLQKYGFKMMPNFILYGESGTGKTQAVKAFCDHLGLKVLEINSATIGATCIHETPMKINKIFEEAFEEEKAVIVIDEADAFLCERSNLSYNAEYRVEEVNAFLQCIDKAVEHNTLVISITNYLNRIDRAILRSGRLGVHIEVKNPDEQDIKEVIESCFDNTEHEEFDLHKLSKVLTGQNLANIFSILNEVKIDALMEDETITQNMLMDKINRTQGYTLKAGANFELPGQKVFEDYVNENIVDHLSNPEYYRRFNLKFPNSILLYGPTGTGKTFCARKLADFLGWKFYQLDSKNIGSESVNGSAMKIADIFKKARNEAPCIIFIDEIDAWLPKRSMFISGSEVSQVNEFLSNMSQLNSDNLLLIGTTNRLDDIDEAALRNGRFSAKIEIGYMRTEQIADLLENLLADIPHDETVDVSEIAEKLDNKSAADVVACFEKACRYGAINKYESLTSECFTETMEITPKKEHKVQRLGFI